MDAAAGTLRIAGVELDGQPFTDFDADALRLNLAAGVGGHFEVHFEAVAPVAVEAPPTGPVGGLAAAPNPFLRGTRLIFDLTRAADVRLAVFDALGREVAVLHDGPRPAGRHEAGLAGAELAPGVYVVRLTTPDGVAATTVTRLP
jgi:hypothetical protein